MEQPFVSSPFALPSVLRHAFSLLFPLSLALQAWTCIHVGIIFMYIQGRRITVIEKGTRCTDTDTYSDKNVHARARMHARHAPTHTHTQTRARAQQQQIKKPRFNEQQVCTRITSNGSGKVHFQVFLSFLLLLTFRFWKRYEILLSK